MAKGRFDRIRVAAIILAAVGTVLACVPAQADAQAYVGGRGESPADALARNMKELASSPRSFDALIGAGRASLALGDGQGLVLHLHVEAQDDGIGGAVPCP